MMAWRHGAAIAVLALAVALPAFAEPVDADLWRREITIDSGFTGTDELLFGAVDRKGDLIIVVRGPDQRVVVRRKDRVAGVWMNRDKIEFDGVPAFYAVASSRPLDEIAPPSVLARLQIGLDSLRPTPLTSRPAAEVARFRDALLKNRVRDGLYSDQTGRLEFLSDRLFRMPLHFPANVPEGTYRARFILFRNGEMVGETPRELELPVRKVGFEARIDRLARQSPAYYGFTAIIIALFAGWVAARVFDKPYLGRRGQARPS